MKKDLDKKKKLTLHRETLKNLSHQELQNIVGGATLQNSCDTATWRGCTNTDFC